MSILAASLNTLFNGVLSLVMEMIVTLLLGGITGTQT